MYYISIDPGKHGAAILMEGEKPKAVFTFTGLKEGIEPLEWLRQVKGWKIKYKVKDAVIERITAMPGQSVATTAEQFYVLGQTKFALIIHNIDIMEVYPQTWMAFARRLCGTPELTGKQTAQILAKKYFRTLAKQYTPRTKVHDGVADALGLAAYIQSDFFAQFIDEEDQLHG
jgi:hypothetical protein